ncbi:MAG TPA: hypothetical protein VGJ39_15085 [Vicinamibacterales bacterium]|jgi:hypothetical protein
MDAAHMQMNESLDPVAAETERPIEVLSTTVRVHELTIERPAIAKYLEHIAPDKLEIALVHALEVGVTELVARRERFKK